MNYGWFMVDLWMNYGWIVVDLWLIYGWIMGDGWCFTSIFRYQSDFLKGLMMVELWFIYGWFMDEVWFFYRWIMVDLWLMVDVLLLFFDIKTTCGRGWWWLNYGWFMVDVNFLRLSEGLEAWGWMCWSLSDLEICFVSTNRPMELSSLVQTWFSSLETLTYRRNRTQTIEKTIEIQETVVYSESHIDIKSYKYHGHL